MGEDGAGWFHRTMSEDPDKDAEPGVFQIEPSATRVFVEMHESERGVEGAPGGDHDLRGGEIFCQDDHATGHVEHAGDAGPGIGGGHFSDRAAVLGELAG